MTSGLDGSPTMHFVTLMQINFKMADVMKLCSFLLLLLFLSGSFCAKGKKDSKKKTGKEKVKIGKNILDYNEVDMERLLDQWDVSSNII